MPIYEYACERCESEFEVEQRITDEPIRSCPKCRSRRVKRLISHTSFTLKGGGWYADGYTSNGGAKKAGDASGASSASESKTSSGKSEGSGGSESSGKGESKKAVA